MHISQLKDSKFLKKEDVGTGVLVTIRDCKEFNVSLPGAPEEQKFGLIFDELEKPLILNSTNGNILAAITGSETSDGWIGAKVVLFTDPNISFQGRLVGGVRIRAPKNQSAKAPPRHAPAPEPVAAAGPGDDDENLPF